ncbi:hypothetical protein N7481_005157 [Penicillium waksmanii]|uniref:uncharacterized protein n=1 Tax=Penicillium waksmanii TaxID=69791 RepID=UPI002548567B|nr:uncharacterized protein N7481_005157 [Penicillium waksmanii]KAJ5983058.1 hypothetical protein N7481_005157 [Penicillium waksmanii]
MILIIITAGYSKNITVYRIYKYLGSVIEDTGIYPKEYLLYYSLINIVSTVLGFKRFYKYRYLGELPAEIKADILQIPELVKIRC